jgi:hypothetical protein
LEGVQWGDANPLCGTGVFKVLYGLFSALVFAFAIGFLFYGFVYRSAINNQKADSIKSKIIFSFCVFVMFWTIGFQMTTAKGLTANLSLPVLIASPSGYWSCFNPNDKLFGVLMGVAVGLLFTVPFHFLVLPMLLRTKKSFYLSFNSFGWFHPEDSETTLKLEKIHSKTSFSLQEVESQEGEEEEREEDSQVKSVFQPLQVWGSQL